ncbi:ALDH8A1 [Lepeophtheirus salmonis]|uniref:ALDH8A1 n=1 Tax=Lepeophtheirus salmonis TaxID=72036 RepID=A0A7R8CZC8_LEPSM|nr:ALDH8A1 [Lepeophtheirus salmonis]CAF2949051.1 ALDH8A1 [Lepeophtheirus salmonis]
MNVRRRSLKMNLFVLLVIFQSIIISIDSRSLDTVNFPESPSEYVDKKEEKRVELKETLPPPEPCKFGLTFCGEDESKYLPQEFIESSRREKLPNFGRSRNIKNKWKYIIQIAQIVNSSSYTEVLICEKPGKTCINDIDSPDGEGSTVCRQAYRRQRLLAMDENGEPSVDSFPLPSGCICHHMQNDPNLRRAYIFNNKTEEKVQNVDTSNHSDINLRFTQVNAPIDLICSTDEESQISLTNGRIRRNNGIIIIFPDEPVTSIVDMSSFKRNDDLSERSNVNLVELFQRKEMIRKVEPCPNGDSFCQLLASYPKNFINAAVNHSSADIVAQRVGTFENGEVPLCVSVTEIIHPQKGRNIHGEWRHIVNTDIYMQGWRVQVVSKGNNKVRQISYVLHVSSTLIEKDDKTTGKIWAQIPDSNADIVDRSVVAAKSASRNWAKLSYEKRAAYLIKAADLLESRLDEFAILESQDQGKPVSLAKKRVIHCTTRIPCHQLLYTISCRAPALMAGNTVVCKPSEITSVTAWKLCHIFDEIGLPRGVVNLICGLGGKTGEALIKHPTINAISFTGKLSLELGGKNPGIIFEDADIDKAINTFIRACFMNQGEVCLCIERLFVQESIFEEFKDKFVAKTKKLKVGDPNDPDVFMGPLISSEHQEKVRYYVDLAVKEGANIECGEPANHMGFLDSKFTDGRKYLDPLFALLHFQHRKRFIQRANDVEYGLCAVVFTNDIHLAHKTAAALEVGTVWVNSWLIRDLTMPFGGMKQSGMGREGLLHSIETFTEEKTTCIQLSH